MRPGDCLGLVHCFVLPSVDHWLTGKNEATCCCGTVQCTVSVEIFSTAAQLYEKSNLKKACNGFNDLELTLDLASSFQQGVNLFCLSCVKFVLCLFQD